MVTSLEETPNSSRVHIAVFGKRNSGKSSIINAISEQDTAIVSDVAGTTTDPVYKPIEIYPIGPCVLIDTAGFDDEGTLGEMRIQKTKNVADKADIALVVFSADGEDFRSETPFINSIKEKNIPVIGIVNKSDLNDNSSMICDSIKEKFGIDAYPVSAKTDEGIKNIKIIIANALPKDYELSSITGHLCGEGDSVLLVAPQDIAAPKGRLILPQVQTIRDLLDNKAVVTITTVDKLHESLKALKNPPRLVITDSQVFQYVYENIPKECKLTSFSVLMARFKGDIDEFVKGAEKIETLTQNDRVLIAEACSHTPLDGDIGREKIPNMLRKKIGDKLSIDIVAGNDFPEDLSEYSLVIHCGGCMFGRRYVLNRIARCKVQNVPITNYGIAIAKINGILDKIKTV